MVNHDHKDIDEVLAPGRPVEKILLKKLFKGYSDKISRLERIAAISVAVNVASFGAAGDGIQDDSDAIQQALNSGNPLILYPGNYRVSKTLLVSTPKQTIVGLGGKILCSNSMNRGRVIRVAADGVIISGLHVSNLAKEGSRVGDALTGIWIEANDVLIQACTIERFVLGIAVSPFGEFHGTIIVGNAVCDVLGVGGGPNAPQDPAGEDRGDGITVWGSSACVVGNRVTCALNGDGRIGIHAEGLKTLHRPRDAQDDRSVVIVGNLVQGSFRRGIVCEEVDRTLIEANIIEGATWWGIAVARAEAAISGNQITMTRKASDKSGEAWSPRRSGVMIYGCQYATVSGNAITVNQDCTIYAAIAVDGVGDRLGRESSEVLIANNRIIVRGHALGIGMVKCDRCALLSNAIDAREVKQLPAVELDDCFDCVISFNTIRVLGKAPFLVKNRGSAVISMNNVFGFSALGIWDERAIVLSVRNVVVADMSTVTPSVTKGHRSVDDMIIGN